MTFEIREFYGSEALPAIIQLRYEVLRKPLGLSLEQSQFSGDELSTTVHIVGYKNSTTAACLTILFSDVKMPEEFLSGQLRGMAVADGCRGLGLGSRLLEAAHELARQKGVSLWCNARSQAVGFYSKHGWEVTGPEFEVVSVGPHFRMVWKPNQSTLAR
jgi:predicted GNAT family N-acyltransferase